MAGGIPTVGLNHTLDVELHGTTQVTTWYVGLVGATHTFAAGDTLASHAGWAEDTTYTGNRQEFVEAAASSGSTTNSASKAVFPMTGTVTINGCFLCSASSGTSGTLFGEGDFTGGARSVVNGDTLNVTVTVTITSTL
jgi:hypothetical protein